jgi:hypothetical protein
MLIIYEVVSKSSSTVIAVTATVREDEREAQVTILEVYCISLPRAPRCEHALFLHDAFFSTSCFALSAMDGKIEQRVCNKFYVKLGKSVTETLEMLREAFGEYSLNRTLVFLMTFTFQGRLSVS